MGARTSYVLHIPAPQSNPSLKRGEILTVRKPYFSPYAQISSFPTFVSISFDFTSSERTKVALLYC